MEEKLLEDLKKAMKSGNIIEKNTIQFLRAQILKARKDKQVDLTDQEIENIIMQDRKKRYEALALYEKGNRPDLMEQTYKEIAVVNKYLPQPLSNYEIENKIKEIINNINANKSMFGKVISEIVKKLLEV